MGFLQVVYVGGLTAQPFFPGEAGLLKNTDQQISTDVTPVRIGKDQSHVAPGHK